MILGISICPKKGLLNVVIYTNGLNISGISIRRPEKRFLNMVIYTMTDRK